MRISAFVIELYSQSAQIIKQVTAAAAGVAELVVETTWSRNIVMQGNYDLVATTGQLNPGVERFAAQFGAMVLVLPEGAEYLGGKGKHGHVAVLGADYRDVKF